MKKNRLSKFILSTLVLSTLVLVSGCANTKDNPTAQSSSSTEESYKNDIQEITNLTIDKKGYSVLGAIPNVSDEIDMDYKLDLPAEVIEEQAEFDLSSLKGIKVIETVPSLDTPVCSAQTAELSLYSKAYPEVSFVTISQDLPFAISSYFKAKNIDSNFHILSDYKNKAFSKNNNLLINENQLNIRSIMILDNDNKIEYISYAQEVTDSLDLNAMLNALDKILEN